MPGVLISMDCIVQVSAQAAHRHRDCFLTVISISEDMLCLVDAICVYCVVSYS